MPTRCVSGRMSEYMSGRGSGRLSAGLLAVGLTVFLTSCENVGTLAGGGARSDYMVARQALETGNYDLAIRNYEKLLRDVGPDAARLRLEYAHSLLRANRFDAAMREAGQLIDTQTGALQGAALSVRGTARHEAARARMSQGQRDAEVTAMLQGARSDLAAFLRDHAGLDAAGSMRARTELIAADLRETS